MPNRPAEKPKSNKKQGGQPGHAKHERALIPSEQCEQVLPLKPDSVPPLRPNAAAATTPEPLRHQVWEFPRSSRW